MSDKADRKVKVVADLDDPQIAAALEELKVITGAQTTTEAIEIALRLARVDLDGRRVVGPL